MIDAKRRKFLVNTLISSAALGYCYQMPMGSFSEPRSNIGLSRELIAVFNQWVENGLGDPVEYLSSIEDDLMDSVALSKKMAADFENDNLFVVNGLVLSFTEAIIMSNLGLASLNLEHVFELSVWS